MKLQDKYSITIDFISFISASEVNILIFFRDLQKKKIINYFQTWTKTLRCSFLFEKLYERNQSDYLEIL